MWCKVGYSKQRVDERRTRCSCRHWPTCRTRFVPPFVLGETSHDFPLVSLGSTNVREEEEEEMLFFAWSSIAVSFRLEGRRMLLREMRSVRTASVESCSSGVEATVGFI
jgi:hypothetical protein